MQCQYIDESQLAIRCDSQESRFLLIRNSSKKERWQGRKLFSLKKKKYIEGQLGQHTKTLSKTENTTNKKVDCMGEKL